MMPAKAGAGGGGGGEEEEEEAGGAPSPVFSLGASPAGPVAARGGAVVGRRRAAGGMGSSRRRRASERWRRRTVRRATPRRGWAARRAAPTTTRRRPTATVAAPWRLSYAPTRLLRADLVDGGAAPVTSADDGIAALARTDTASAPRARTVSFADEIGAAAAPRTRRTASAPRAARLRLRAHGSARHVAAAAHAQCRAPPPCDGQRPRARAGCHPTADARAAAADGRAAAAGTRGRPEPVRMRSSPSGCARDRAGTPTAARRTQSEPVARRGQQCAPAWRFGWLSCAIRRRGGVGPAKAGGSTKAEAPPPSLSGRSTPVCGGSTAMSALRGVLYALMAASPNPEPRRDAGGACFSQWANNTATLVLTSWVSVHICSVAGTRACIRRNSALPARDAAAAPLTATDCA